MLDLKLLDKSFIMCGPSMGTGSTGKAPTKIKWIVHESVNKDDIFVFTDYCLEEVDNYSNVYKIALILEPPSVIPHIYQWISKNYNKFDNILTFDKDLLRISNKFIFSPNATGHWLKDEDIKLHEKTELISIIASNKNITDGHQLRHNIVSKYNTRLNGIFGRGSYKTLDDKIDGLKTYAFHITIENTKKDYYFSEKLIDVLLTGCIPIYYGCPSIQKCFNTNGFLCFNNIKEFDKIINEYVNFDYYSEIYNKGIIQENFELAKKYLFPEDYIYDNFLKGLICKI